MRLVVLLLVCCAVACTAPVVVDQPKAKHSTTSTTDDDSPAPNRTDEDTPGDDGEGPRGPTYTPAFLSQLSMPRLLNQGGPILAHPDIVTVTWDGEPDRATFEALGDHIGASSYWKAITGEYGVGPATGGKHVHLKNAAASMTTDQLSQLVANGSRNGWPAPTSQTFYMVYLDKRTTLLEDGKDMCDTFEGFHQSVTLSNGSEVAWGVVMQCDYGTGVDPAEVTLIASHEIAEAALDPMSNMAWIGVDDDHLAWDVMQAFQDENGDLCEYFPEAGMENPAPALPFTVQRMWSNASAAAGHNPCVPAPADPYFNVTPITPLSALSVNVDSLTQGQFDARGARPTKGLKLGAAGTATVDLGLFSDAPTGAWKVEAYETDAAQPFSSNGGLFPRAQRAAVRVTLDKSTGLNGDKITLTVRAVSASSIASTPIGASLVIVKSTLGSSMHFLPILVQP